MTLNLVRTPDDDASIPDPAAQGKANAAVFVELDAMAKRIAVERAGRLLAEQKLKDLTAEVAAHSRALRVSLLRDFPDLVEVALWRGGSGGYVADLFAEDAATIAQILLLVERAGKSDE